MGSYKLARVTTPIAFLTRAETKAHLNITHTTDDALIDQMQDTVENYLDGADGILGRALVSQQWKLSLDTFPVNSIRLPLPPLITVDTVAYTDNADAPQTVATSVYQTAERLGRTFLLPKNGQAWPTDESLNKGLVDITFTAGYGVAASDVPTPVRHAALLMIGWLYERRESVMTSGRSMGFSRAVMENPSFRGLLAPFIVDGWGTDS